ncbi:hypothetical protein T261_1101 [Streptomyces lydicus]|nr:hypothetical protein T261_1101 [Streptomyces lydicus]
MSTVAASGSPVRRVPERAVVVRSMTARVFLSMHFLQSW